MVPIVVGSISHAKAKKFGKILTPYFKDEKTLFIISSDFCHWGNSFDYCPVGEDKEPVSDFIKRLDHEGMEAIEEQDGEKFDKYLKDTENTICGRHPISVLLAILKESELETTTQFVQYA